MKKIKLFLSLLLVGAMFITSCEGEESSSTTGGCEGLEALANTLSQKANVFNNNPTSSNCSAMKSAALKLLDAAKKCDGPTAAQYQQAAQAWDNVDCSAFD